MKKTDPPRNRKKNSKSGNTSPDPEDQGNTGAEPESKNQDKVDKSNKDIDPDPSGEDLDSEKTESRLYK